MDETKLFKKLDRIIYLLEIQIVMHINNPWLTGKPGNRVEGDTIAEFIAEIPDKHAPYIRSADCDD